jgi:phage portal protein BeeE
VANLLSVLRGTSTRYSVDDWIKDKYFTYNGVSYPIVGLNQYGSKTEDIESSFDAYVQSVYKANPIVFAAVEARRQVFSEARFQWQRMERGRPTDLFGDQELAVLERPWPNGTTGELLSRAEQDTSFGGNFYAIRERTRIRRFRPDWVSIILSAPPDEAVASDVVGYVVKPGGPLSKADPVTYLPEQMCHWSPIPDPLAQYRGMSWLTPVIREVMADKAAADHKLKFFENGATLSTIVGLKDVTDEQFDEFVGAFRKAHEGVANAYRTLFLAGAVDTTVVGTDLRQIDFKQTQGAGETRISAASRVPAVILGISEGMQGSSLNAGNYDAAKKNWERGFMRPHWRSACAAFESLVRVPTGARLWYDTRDIAFLRDDENNLAEIRQKDAQTLRTLVDAGFNPDAAVEYVKTGDLSRLVGTHSGLFSVQLQPPGSEQPTDQEGDEQ